MSYESRAYDNEHGDPVVVLVATGTHAVSRLMNLLAGSRLALCEHIGLEQQILRQVNRHNGGQAALKLLAAHGGPDLLETPATIEVLENLEEIRRDLAAVPAPPWRWIGNQVTGPLLVTDHSGQQYILGPSHPVDEHDHQATDDEDRPVYADLEFRDKRDRERYAVMRRSAEMIVPRAPYDPETYQDIDNPVARWIRWSPAHVTALLAEVDRLQHKLRQTRASYELLKGDFRRMRERAEDLDLSGTSVASDGDGYWLTCDGCGERLGSLTADLDLAEILRNKAEHECKPDTPADTDQAEEG